MKLIKNILFTIFCLSITSVLQAQISQELTLRYYKPAQIWEETLPLGNGRIGMMPDGGIENENIILNDITMWSGSEDETVYDIDALDYLPQIRQLLIEGKNIEAQELMYKHFRCGGKGSAFGSGKDATYGAFQILGELQIKHKLQNPQKAVNYQRFLSLNDAVAYTNFEIDGVSYKREYFASHSNDVLVLKYSSNKKSSISFEVNLDREERAEVHLEDGNIVMVGQLNDGINKKNGVKFYTKLKVINSGGKLIQNKHSLSVENANEVVILISTSTNMLDEDYAKSVNQKLKIAEKIKSKTLKTKHISKYKEKFDRVDLYLGEQDNSTSTHQRMIDFQKNDDASFAALYFQFGRYLMISGTNENSLPLNLQGLWANQTQTPWNGDYHININLQMNYWPVHTCNLSELNLPLAEFTKSLVESGSRTAKEFYGTDGWVAHVISNPWRFTAPGEHASWGATNTGGAWLSRHLWEHYEFTNDIEYLQSVYPTILESAQFFIKNLIVEPKNGWFVTAPSSSPENAFYMPKSDEAVYVCMGPTMDMQIVRELFENLLEAAEILQKDDDILNEIREILPNLAPMQISNEGYLQEWLEDYKEVEIEHRHVSHLFGLYPSNQISPLKTPQLAQAAQKTLERRGDGGTGWSMAWKINFWARLHQGDRAYSLLKNLLAPVFDEQGNTISGGGTYPNLFCAHPPFQIDGNFGGIAGIAEMLLQSQNGYLELLPALPQNWKSGYVKGLKARGNIQVDIFWQNAKVESIKLKSFSPNKIKIEVPKGISLIKTSNKPLDIIDGFIIVEFQKDEEKHLIFE